MAQRLQSLNIQLQSNKCSSRPPYTDIIQQFWGQNRITEDKNILLINERKKVTFAINDMISILDGSPQNTKQKYWIRSMADQSEFTYKKYNLTRAEQLKTGMKQFINIHKKFPNYKIKTRKDFCWMYESANFHGSLGNSLSIFLGSMSNLGTTQQFDFWKKQTITFGIVGCYAQTELGHGSNVRGLQTTATYDNKTKEFIIDTPTLESIKWLPGALGLVCTHASVFAQLIVDGKECGIHCFLVQLRDENHKHLQGIITGDLGAKVGDNGNDTGYLAIHQVRIPKDNMLRKYYDISETGQFIKIGSPDKNVHYATMIFARIHLIYSAFTYLAKCVIITTRYNCMRRQGFKNSQTGISFKSDEHQIIDYKLQQYRIFKQIAIVYAMKINVNFLIDFASQIELGQITSSEQMIVLKDLLILTASIKGLFTILSGDGCEDLRKTCGGNGFLLHSGIGLITLDNLLNVTAEGDFSLLLLFSSKYLMKAVKQVFTGQPQKGELEYLNKINEQDFRSKIKNYSQPAKNILDFDNLEYLLYLFEFRALKRISTAAAHLNKKITKDGFDIDAASNFCQLHLKKASEAHTYLFVLKQFVNSVKVQKEQHPKISQILKQLCSLFALTNLLDGDWSGILQNDQYDLLNAAVDSCLEQIRPNCIGLVESLDYPDWILNSSIWKKDGKLYENLFEAAYGTNLNDQEPFEGYEEILKPHLNMELLKHGNKKIQ